MRNLEAIAIAGALLVRAASAQSITPPFPVALEKELAARASKYTEARPIGISTISQAPRPAGLLRTERVFL